MHKLNYLVIHLMKVIEQVEKDVQKKMEYMFMHLMMKKLLKDKEQ